MNERQKIALFMRRSGSTFSQIGKSLKVSRSRAAKIVDVAAFSERMSTPFSAELGIRWTQAARLADCGYTSTKDIREAISNGSLNKNSCPGIGAVTLREIAAIVGAQVPGKPLAIRRAMLLLEKNGYAVVKRRTIAARNAKKGKAA